MSITITNEDNMQLMARYPDKYFDLAIVDPPYGIGISKIVKYSGSRYTSYKKKEWDSDIPCDAYFNELFRVSKNQIVFGGNYFNLPPCPNWIIWDKVQPEKNDFGKYELAWNSTNIKGKIFYLSASFDRGGNIKGNNKALMKSKARIHPTQKPVSLYMWVLKNYAKEGDNILDTHLGSGSIAIACHDLGFDLTACELDKDYYEAAMKRIAEHQRKIKIDFKPKKEWQQGGLF